jgi:hypothetical protein
MTYLPPDGPRFELEERPLLASWERWDHPEQQRLRAYLERMVPVVPARLDDFDGPAAVELHVGLGNSANLLRYRDLDNYLEPIARRLPERVCSFWAEKSTSASSWLTVAPAVPASESALADWEAAGAQSKLAGGSTPWKETIQRGIAATSIPAPDGAVQLQVVFRVSGDRNWINLWKPAIDALDPILGRTDPDRAFHPRDDRIVRLGLHHLPAVGGIASAVRVYWKAAGGFAPTEESALHALPAEPPSLSPDFPVPPEPSAEHSDAVFFLDGDEGYEQWWRSHPRGYVLNVDRRPRRAYLKLHRSSCDLVTNSKFRGGGWTTGAYAKVKASPYNLRGPTFEGCRCN